jgi:hypothetical protein
VGTIARGESSVPFGDVQGHTGRGAIHLILDVRTTGAARAGLRPPCDECDRFLVDVQLFVVEVDFHRVAPRVLLPDPSRNRNHNRNRELFDYDYDYDYD